MGRMLAVAWCVFAGLAGFTLAQEVGIRAQHDEPHEQLVHAFAREMSEVSYANASARAALASAEEMGELLDQCSQRAGGYACDGVVKIRVLMMQASLRRELRLGGGDEAFKAAREACLRLKGPRCGDEDLGRLGAGRPASAENH